MSEPKITDPDQPWWDRFDATVRAPSVAAYEALTSDLIIELFTRRSDAAPSPALTREALGIEYDRGLHDGYRQCADIDAPRLEALRLLIQWADDATHDVPEPLREELRQARALLSAGDKAPR